MEIIDTWTHTLKDTEVTFVLRQHEDNKFSVVGSINEYMQYKVTLDKKPDREWAMRALMQKDLAFRRAVGLE